MQAGGSEKQQNSELAQGRNLFFGCQNVLRKHSIRDSKMRELQTILNKNSCPFALAGRGDSSANYTKLALIPGPRS